MYDESIEVDDDDEEEEYELLQSRRRHGVSPVRRGPFQFHQQRPTRSFVRDSVRRRDSFEMSDEESPPPVGQEAPPSLPPPPQAAPPPVQQPHHPKPHHESRKNMSSKDFTGTPPPHHPPEGGGGAPVPAHGNLISLASSYAKKLMSSGSDKKQEKPPADVIEARKEVKAHEGKKHPPPIQHQQSSSSSTKSPTPTRGRHQPPPPPPTQQAQPHPLPPQRTRSEEEEDNEEDDDEDYDDVNMAQIEGLLNRVTHPKNSIPFRRMYANIPNPPQPPPQAYLPPQYDPRARMDRGGAGEPYSVHQGRALPPQMSALGGFHPGFGPATSNLMAMSQLEESDPEIDISESDMNLTRMDELMEMYTNPSGLPTDPQSMLLTLPSPELSELAMVDDEILENIVAHRKAWEYQIDLKREALRRRTLVMSDFVGVHASGHAVYNPQEYEHLNVSPEVKELFHYITRYEPPVVGTQMDVKLKPFIPEYYPSVGDIDAFIKVVHPEIQEDNLGIKYLDEPSPFQSDPSVLDLRLRALAKQSSSKSVVVKKIDNVGKNTKIIENWIKDISDLHRSKPSPSVHYSKPMPDIDLLIQEWPPHLEELLKSITLPSAELDCDLSTYVDIVCNLLDIPVYKSRIQSLHVLCTLYATYKHFNHYGPLGMAGAGGGGPDLDQLPFSNSIRIDDNEVDRLQINN